MKIEHMREFVVFCEHMNFTAAAKCLYMTQPALSYHVAAMEKELGFLLVERSEALRLTPPGRLFLAKAQDIVERYEDAVTSCSRLAKSQAGRLVIERPAGMPAASGLFETAVTAFVRDNPQIDVKLTRTDGRHLYEVLRERIADVGVVFDFADPAEPVLDGGGLSDVTAQSSESSFTSRVDGSGIVYLPLPPYDDPALYVLMHRTHPLAERGLLRAEDFEGCGFAIQSDQRFRVGQECFIRMFARCGVYVHFRGKAEGDDIDFLWSLREGDLLLSDAGMVGMNERGMGGMEGFVLRRIDDERLRVTPYLAYLASNKNPALARLIDALR